MTVVVAGLAIALGALVVGLTMIWLLGATLGRRARAGRLSGRYTSRPGNSSDPGSSSSGGAV
jgi:hypothetical protein